MAKNLNGKRIERCRDCNRGECGYYSLTYPMPSCPLPDWTDAPAEAKPEPGAEVYVKVPAEEWAMRTSIIRAQADKIENQRRELERRRKS